MQKFSSILCNELGSTEMQKYMQTQEYVQLVQCFLQPSRMQRHQAKEKMNPIYELFRPDNLRKQGTVWIVVGIHVHCMLYDIGCSIIMLVNVIITQSYIHFDYGDGEGVGTFMDFSKIRA